MEYVREESGKELMYLAYMCRKFGLVWKGRTLKRISAKLGHHIASRSQPSSSPASTPTIFGMSIGATGSISHH